MHILVVDDEPLVTDALRVLFETTGHSVDVANDVDAAVERCVSRVPDILVLDISVGRENGLTVLDRTRTARVEPRVTLALTGHDDDATLERCRKAGCADVLLKPVAPRVLVRRVNELLAVAG